MNAPAGVRPAKGRAAEMGRVLLVAPSPPPYGGMALQAKLLDRLLQSDGCPVELFASNFPLPRWLQAFEKVPGLRTALRTALIVPRLWAATGRTDVVHVLAASWWYFFLVVYPAAIVSVARCKRLVLNYRGGEAERFFRFYGWAAAPVFRAAAAVTAPSEFLAGPIRGRFAVDVSIVPNILDARAFVFRQRTSIQPKMVVARHLEKIYDIESVLRAFGRVQARYPEASLWIAGTGSQEQALRNMAAGWNLPNVRFLGRVEHARLPEIYGQCDILLNASTVDNFPGSLVEASAAGLAVVSTAAGGIPFIYQHRRSALLVSPGDWEGLAAAVEEVLQSPSLAAAMIAEGARIARACDWVRVRTPLYRSYGFRDAAGENRGEAVCENASQAPQG